jgi:hypothetical protein
LDKPKSYHALHKGLISLEILIGCDDSQASKIKHAEAATDSVRLKNVKDCPSCLAIPIAAISCLSPLSAIDNI